MLDDIKEGDYVLIHSSKDQSTPPYCIIHIDYTGFDGGYYIHGIIVKTNLKYCLFSNHRHYYNNNPDIIKKINNKSEIEELSLIHKLYLLKES